MEKPSIEQRLNLVHRIMMLIGHQANITGAPGPQIEFFWVARAILVDDYQYRCNTRTRLIQMLRKSDLWEEVKPYLKNNDERCRCNHGKYWHTGPTKNCLYENYQWSRKLGKSVKKSCECTCYRPKSW